MKEQFTTNVINLKSYNISEADKIIVMYSKERGLIKGVAKGIKKTSSKLGGRMDLLVANKMMLNKGKTLDTICQAEALNTFFNLRSDINKLFYAMYCLRRYCLSLNVQSTFCFPNGWGGGAGFKSPTPNPCKW